MFEKKSSQRRVEKRLPFATKVCEYEVHKSFAHDFNKEVCVLC